MNIIETSEVLAKIQTFDNRTVDEATVTVWHEVLEPYQIHDARRAVTEYYTHNRTWLMPSDLVDRIKEYRVRRLQEFGADVRISEADENRIMRGNGSMRELHAEASSITKQLRTMAADGHITPEQFKAYADDKIALADLMRLKAVTR